MNMENGLLDLLTLNKESALVQQLLNEFFGSSGIEATGPVATQAARQIFRQRARHTQSICYPIHGFPELVNGLEAFTGDAITILMSVLTAVIMPSSPPRLCQNSLVS